MISINLLPVKQIRARLKAQKEVLALIVLLVAVLAVVGIVGAVRSSQVTSQKEQIRTLTQKRDSYKATLNQIEKLKKDKKNLETKLAVIGTLKKESQFTVRMLDELAKITPAGRVRLNSMSQNETRLILSGVAVDDASIALYMEQLDGSAYFASPELGASSVGTEDGRGVRGFSLVCEITGPEKEKMNPEEKK